MNICLQEIDWGMILGIIFIREKGIGQKEGLSYEAIATAVLAFPMWTLAPMALQSCPELRQVYWAFVSHTTQLWEVPWNWGQGVNLGKVAFFGQGQFLWRKFNCEFQQPTLPAPETKNALANWGDERNLPGEEPG